MSHEDSGQAPPPLTRAAARAAREAAEAARAAQAAAAATPAAAPPAQAATPAAALPAKPGVPGPKRTPNPERNGVELPAFPPRRNLLPKLDIAVEDSSSASDAENAAEDSGREPVAGPIAGPVAERVAGPVAERVAGPVAGPARAEDNESAGVAPPTFIDPASRKPIKLRTLGIHRRWVIGGAIAVVLILAGVAYAIVTLLQGPQLAGVKVDPRLAIESASSVALTVNQPVTAVDASQVSVEPEVPFTVETDGRNIAIFFGAPLDDSTSYTVRVTDVTAQSGGKTNNLQTDFVTPASEIFMLLRAGGAEDDKIFRTDLTGTQAVPVFGHARINDFRATTTQLVIAVEEDDGSHVFVMNRDGSNQRELTLPGEGYVGEVQVSEVGGYVGYSYSDRELTEESGRASVLVTQLLSGEDKPKIVEVGGTEASIFAWQFVPGSAALLFVDFDGDLVLTDPITGAAPKELGLATTIQGMSRSANTALIERVDGTIMELNLDDGTEVPLPPSTPYFGIASSITPFPGGMLQHVVERNDATVPVGQSIIRVDEDGQATPLVAVSGTDSIVQSCASPSGQYAAVVIAPDMPNNDFDDMLVPLPKNLETHIVEIATGKDLVSLTGFDVSWCHIGPRF